MRNNADLTIAKTIRLFISDWKRYREYVIQSARAELQAEITNTYLDWVWWLLEPFCLMIVYAVVFGLIFHLNERYYPVFVFMGITMWRYFSMTVNGSATLMRRQKTTITKVYIPKQMFVINLMLRNGFKMLLSFVIIFLMMIFYRIPLSVFALMIIPALLLLILVTFFVSCIIMHLGVSIEDMSYVINIGLTMLMYFTGTFWSVENRIPAPYGLIISRVNPIAFSISMGRNGLLYGTNSFHWTYFVWLGVALLLSIAAIRMIYKNENTYVKVL